MLLRVHLKNIVLPDLTTCRLSLNPNVIYLGKPFSDVESSVFYRDLPVENYKLWFKQEIDSKGDVYQALVELKDLLIESPYVLVLFICDCEEEEENNCRTVILKKAIFNLHALNLI